MIHETLAGAARLTGLDVPALFLMLYVITLVVVGVAAVSFSRVLASRRGQ